MKYQVKDCGLNSFQIDIDKELRIAGFYLRTFDRVSNHLLVNHILAIDGVNSVVLSPYHLLVEKGTLFSINDIAPRIADALSDHFQEPCHKVEESVKDTPNAIVEVETTVEKPFYYHPIVKIIVATVVIFFGAYYWRYLDSFLAVILQVFVDVLRIM